MSGLYILLLAGLVAGDPWRTYEVYQPQIKQYDVVSVENSRLQYNHCSSIAWFKDRWFCLWNGNQTMREGDPGQPDYMSTSRDGKVWTTAEPAFADPRYSVNPIPCPTGYQWQPNLIVVKDELWAFWNQVSKDDYAGCYFSRLSEPDGKWTNRRLLWDGRPGPMVGGTRWRVFPSQNAVQLRSGRVLVPVILMGAGATDVPPDILKGFWRLEKRDSVIYSDDGKTWHVSPGASLPEKSWAQWEPTVWEVADGTVMMFARNNDHRAPNNGGPSPAERLCWSMSKDGGQTWTPHQYVPLETVSSRMHVIPTGGNRFVMAHNDWPAGTFGGDRHNLALFFKRGAGIDFVAGPGFVGNDLIVTYPHMWIRNDELLVSYTDGHDPRSIKVAHVRPLPDPQRYYIFPRNNDMPSPAPERAGNAYRFEVEQYVATRRLIDTGQNAVSIGAWVQPIGDGLLFDNRTSDPAGGFSCGLHIDKDKRRLRLSVNLGTREGNLEPDIEVPRYQWSYIGFTVDNQNRIVTFYLNDQSRQMPFTGPVTRPLGGTTVHLGGRCPAGTSKTRGLRGHLRMLAIYTDRPFGSAQHAWLYNQFGTEMGRLLLPSGDKPFVAPAVWFDPADDKGFQRDFVLPEARPRVQTAVIDGKQVLLFEGETSAGLDLDENHRERGDRVRIAFRFKIEQGNEHILCTVGDANNPARLIARAGHLLLQAGTEAVRCGSIKDHSWTDVEVVTGGRQTTATMIGLEPLTVSHEPVATWVYLGQGYRRGTIPDKNCFLVDVASVRSRVEGHESPAER